MELIGEYLKNQRIKRKYSIPQISRELHISKDLLISIENDNFPEFVNQVYMMGHIRSYAKFLELDQIKIIENFKIQNSYNRSNLENKISKPLQNKKIFNFYRPLSYGSVLVLSFGFYFLFVKPSNLDFEYAMTPNVPENLSSNLEEIEMNLSLIKGSQKSLKKLNLKQNQKSMLIDENISVTKNSSSAVASLFDQESIDAESIINLKFLNPTWVQLRDKNNNIILSKLMDQGDQYSYDVSKNYYLTAGNAGNIIISLNGIVKGKAGKLGEVIDSLIVDQNFNN